MPSQGNPDATPAFLSVAPQFTVPDVVAASKYYCDVLGFRSLGFFGSPPVFAMVARGAVDHRGAAHPRLRDARAGDRGLPRAAPRLRRGPGRVVATRAGYLGRALGRTTYAPGLHPSACELSVASRSSSSWFSRSRSMPGLNPNEWPLTENRGGLLAVSRPRRSTSLTIAFTGLPERRVSSRSILATSESRVRGFFTLASSCKRHGCQGTRYAVFSRRRIHSSPNSFARQRLTSGIA